MSTEVSLVNTKKSKHRKARWIYHPAGKGIWDIYDRLLYP